MSSNGLRRLCNDFHRSISDRVYDRYVRRCDRVGTMKFPYGFGLSLPYQDEEGVWHRTMISTNDPIDHRRVKRGIRTWIKQNLGRSIADKELRVVYKAVMRHTEPKVYVMHRRAVSEKQLAEING